mmetsp:Transcript_32229/g.63499  ORF Transcript_32229/g.63499 Transcript_32229/m.63499 type:complete len:165 (+) Transcript_32229:95-589(+)
MAESPRMPAATTTDVNAERQIARRKVVSFSEIERHFPICFTKGSPTCAICLTTIEETDPCRKTKCNHEFHADCIMKWWTKERGCLLNCPICREPQSVTVKKMTSEVRQTQQREQCRKPWTRLLKKLRAVLPKLPKLSKRGRSSTCGETASEPVVGLEEPSGYSL